MPGNDEARAVGRCANCAKWEVEPPYENGYVSAPTKLGLGICKAVPMLWDSRRWGKDDEQEWVPGTEATTAFAQDGSDYQAFLFTKGEHGCTMFTPLATPPAAKEA